jgi:heme O synthase-like polyprenyltransferase
MLPSWDVAGFFTANEVVTLIVALVAMSVVPNFLHYQGRIYLTGSVLAGTWFLAEGVRLAWHRSKAAAKCVLRVSVLNLPVLFALMIFDRMT